MTLSIGSKCLQSFKNFYLKHKKTLYNNRDIIYSSTGFLSYQLFRKLVETPYVMNSLKKRSPTYFCKVAHFKGFLDREHTQTFIKQGTLNLVAYLMYSRIFGHKEASLILSGTVLYGMHKALTCNNFSPARAIIPCGSEKPADTPIEDDAIKRVVQHIQERVTDKDFSQRIILLVGPSGAGKSQLIQHLQNAESKGGKSLCYRLDISRLKDRGAAVEDPLNRLNLLTEYLRVESDSQGSRKALLFLDELRYVMGSDNTGRHFFDAFKKFLEEQTQPLPFFIISAMTSEEYDKFAKEEEAMIRRIDRVNIVPRSPDTIGKLFKFDDDQISYILHNILFKHGPGLDNLLMGDAAAIKKQMRDKGSFQKALSFHYGLDEPLTEDILTSKDKSPKGFSFSNDSLEKFKGAFPDGWQQRRYEAIALHCLMEKGMDCDAALKKVSGVDL